MSDRENSWKPETPDSAPKDNTRKEFIKEKIEPPKRKKKGLMMALILLCSAVIFGGISSLTFVLTRPWIEKNVGKETTEALESIHIPQDEVGEEEPVAEDIQVQLDEDMIQSLVDSKVEAYLSTMDPSELSESIENLNIIQELKASMASALVTVTSSEARMDVFQNEFTHSDQTFGVVFEKTRKKALILTESYLPAKKGAVYVTLPDNKEKADAEVLGINQSLGLAVISIRRDDLSDSGWKSLTEAKLGNSYRVKEGDKVVAMGNPVGRMGSVNEGIITYINPEVQGLDMNFSMFQTDMTCVPDASGILLNIQGEIVGWITQKFNSGAIGNLLAAISISELKSTVESLSNGQETAALGIQMVVVNANLAEDYDLPQGIYITSCKKDGPAYAAGIQNGDILISVDGNSVLTVMEFHRVMQELEPGSEVDVVVLRQGRDGYAEVEYTVKLGTR